MKKFLAVIPIAFALLANVVLWAATFYLYHDTNGAAEAYYDWMVTSAVVSILTPAFVAIWVGIVVYNGLHHEN